MNDEIEILESIPTKIRYKDIIFYSNNGKVETVTLSGEKIKCWLRFKNVKSFNLNDIREAFPEWSRYAKSQLINKLNPLLKDKIVDQFPNNEFKVK